MLDGLNLDLGNRRRGWAHDVREGGCTAQTELPGRSAQVNFTLKLYFNSVTIKGAVRGKSRPEGGGTP